MNIFAHPGHEHSENVESIVSQSATPDDGMTKVIAIGAVVLFVALVIAILVARRR